MHHDDHFDRAQHRMWRKFEAMGRRGGWGGPGGGPRGGFGGWGDWGGFGDNMRIGRMLASGDLRLIALYFIEQQPRHGYDLIKAIEDRSGGAYAPSPGVVYPTLTMLEDMGLIAEQATEGSKRLFAITDAGKIEVGEKAEQIEALFARIEALSEQRSDDDRSPIKRAMINLAMALRSRVRHGDRSSDLAHDIAALLDETARRIERL